MRSSPLQGCELQGRPSSTTPSHRYDSSGGDWQVRVRVCIPPPHSLLHCAHCPHILQPPRDTQTKRALHQLLSPVDPRVLSYGPEGLSRSGQYRRGLKCQPSRVEKLESFIQQLRTIALFVQMHCYVILMKSAGVFFTHREACKALVLESCQCVKHFL